MARFGTLTVRKLDNVAQVKAQSMKEMRWRKNPVRFVSTLRSKVSTTTVPSICTKAETNISGLPVGSGTAYWQPQMNTDEH